MEYLLQKSKIFLTLLWNEFIYGGHLLSLGAVSIVYTAAVLLGIKITWDGLLIFYLGPQAVYLYNRYKEFKEDILTNPERTKYIEKHVKMIPLLIFFLILIFVGILLYFNKAVVLLFSLLLFLFSFFYSLVFKKITKKIVNFKNFFVSLMWSLLVMVLIIYYSFSFNLSVFLIIIFVFLRLFVNTNFFDIKDIESDEKEGLLTLPIILGRKNFLNLLHVINFISFVPIIIGVIEQILPCFSLFLLLLFFYSLFYLEKIRKQNINIQKISYIMVDGEYILWPLILFLGKFSLIYGR